MNIKEPYTYYSVDTTITEGLFKQYSETVHKKRQEAHNELCSYYPTMCPCAVSLKGTSVVGIIGTELVDINGLKYELSTVNNKTTYTYTPNRRYKEGKLLASRLQTITEVFRENPDFSTWFLHKFRLEHSVIYSYHGIIRHAVAGISKGQIVFKIPVEFEEANNVPPDVPENFKQIKKSEFIALTEE